MSFENFTLGSHSHSVIVGETGLEPATWWSQTTYSTNWNTPRYNSLEYEWWVLKNYTRTLNCFVEMVGFEPTSPDFQSAALTIFATFPYWPLSPDWLRGFIHLIEVVVSLFCTGRETRTLKILILSQTRIPDSAIPAFVIPQSKLTEGFNLFHRNKNLFQLIYDLVTTRQRDIVDFIRNFLHILHLFQLE